MLVIEVEWVPFCEDGWVATDGKNERAVLLKVDKKWHISVATFNNSHEPPPYDTFKEARDKLFSILGIEQASRGHLQALFAAGYRRA